ncbi:MAG TPA: GEVED domain-containing protein [Edaphocola sp.]|nr:GEVED domain-containing protein [Edaphocola sp.]
MNRIYKFTKWQGPRWMLLFGAALLSFVTGHGQLAPACSPSYTGSDFSHNIGSVTINSLNLSSISYSTHDYTTDSFNADAGDSVSFSLVSHGWCAVAAAADWNNDGDFGDPGEILAMPSYIASDPATYSFKAIVPPTVITGSYRVRLWNIGANSGSGTPAGSPCGAYSYGSWLDVTVNVTNNHSCFPPSMLAVNSVSSGTASFSWNASSTSPNSYIWKVVISGSNPDSVAGVASGNTTDTFASVSGLSGLTDYSAFVRSDCGADSSLWSLAADFSTLCDGTPAAGTAAGSDSAVCAATDLTLSLSGASAGMGISYQWQSSLSGQNSWADLADDTLSSVTLNQSSATDYRCIVSCAGSGLSDTSNVVAIAQNPATECYCTPLATSSYNPYYITSFDANGQGSSTFISNDNTGLYTNGYGDYSDSMIVGGIPTLGVSFSAATNYGASINIYIDWNQDGDFDDAGETVYASSGNSYTTTSFSGSFTVPATALLGQTRMRVRSNAYYSSVAPCGNASYGETEDYTFNVIPATGCIIPSNIAASNINNTWMTLSWSGPTVGNTPQGYDYEIRTSGTAGSGSLGLVSADSAVSDTAVVVSGLTPGATYTAYVRTECNSSSRSSWTSGFSFTLPTYAPVALSGFNADVIANGIGNASTSTNNDVDGANYALVAQDFKASASGASPTQFVPNGGMISNGIKQFQLADYSGNNSLRLNGSGQSGTLNFLTPRHSMNVYILGVSGSGASSVDATVWFTDGTSQAVTGLSWPDWFQNSGDVVASQVGRIKISSNGLGTGGPYLVENTIAIDSANQSKQISKIDFSTTGTSHVMNILAVSVLPDSNPSCTAPVVLSLDSVSAHAAIVSWSGPATDYQISYVAPGVSADSGTVVDVSAVQADTLTGLASATAYNIFVRSNCSATDVSDWTGPLAVQTLLEQCTGTPSAGMISSSAVSVCPNDPFTLTDSGATVALGVTYMWQSSTHGMNTWDTLASTTNILSVASQSDTTDYRFIAFCANSGQSDTALFTEIQNLPTDCYCTPTYSTGCSWGDEIDNFVLNGASTSINDQSTGCSSGAYDDRTSESVDLIQGNSYDGNIFAATSGDNARIWIDFNDNGIFESSESVALISGIAYSGTPTNFSVNIPATANPGMHRMRVRLVYSTGASSLDPCNNENYGETHDYTANIIALTPCAGMPSPGNTIAADSSFCVSGSSDLLSLENNYITYSGIKYQWQQSTDGTTWTDISNDTLTTATAALITMTTQFRCRLICTNGDDTAYSNPVNVVIHPLPTVTVSPQTATFCSSSLVTLTASGAVTYAWTPVDSLNADTGAVVQANPTVLTQYTVVGTDNYGCSASATANVGPISAINPAATIAYSAACTGAGDPVTVSVHAISVNSGTVEYQFTDSLDNVLQAWSTDTAYTTTPAADGVYKYKVYARLSGCPDSTWTPGAATAYVGFTASVMAVNAGCAGNDGSITIDHATGPGMGGDGLTWYSNDFSTTTLDPQQAAKFGNASFTSGGLQLTPNVTSNMGALSVFNPDHINPLELNVSFDLTVGNGADGFSYNFGDDATWANRTANPEAGISNKLVVSFDAYGNTGIYLVYGNPVTPGGTTPDLSSTGAHVLAYSSNTSWKNATKQVSIKVDNSGKLTLTVGQTLIFDHVQLPASYLTADKSSWDHTFIARTGGISEVHAMDNLDITYSESQFDYGLSAGGSGQLPVTWQHSGSFTGLPGGDSFDVWIANPADSLSCNKFLGTYVIGAPALIASAPQYTTGQQNCGVNDAVLTVQVDSAGTYGVRYRLNGDTAFQWQNGIATINDGTANFIAISNLAPGVYTDISAFKNDTCFSNTLAGPIALAPVINGIATVTSSDSMQQGNGLTLTYRNNNCEQIATVSSSADLGTVKANVVLDTVLYDSAGAPYAGRYYVITPDQNSGQSATLTLYFSNDDIAAYNSAVAAMNNPEYPAMDTGGSNILISAYHGVSSVGTTGPGGMFDSASMDLITPTSIVDNGDYIAVTFTSANGFSGFFAHTVNNSPLALTFGQISAENDGEKNVVQWNTLNEEAGDYFIVERSEDGRTFHKLGTVMGKGMAAYYAYDDVQPVKGVNYYRVAMVALNGHTIYSKVVSASMNTARFNVMVYPNPVSDVLTVKVSGGSPDRATIEVLDVTGRLLKQIKVKNAQTQISMAGLAQGLYILKYQEDNHERIFKINKK